MGYTWSLRSAIRSSLREGLIQGNGSVWSGGSRHHQETRSHEPATSQWCAQNVGFSVSAKMAAHAWLGVRRVAFRFVVVCHERERLLMINLRPACVYAYNSYLPEDEHIPRALRSLWVSSCIWEPCYFKEFPKCQARCFLKQGKTWIMQDKMAGCHEMLAPRSCIHPFIGARAGTKRRKRSESF